jgi:hypothetical protein
MFETLEPKYTGGESFDVFDVNGFSYEYATGDVRKIKPLVSFTDSRSDRWNTEYTKPIIYDLHQMLTAESFTNWRFFRANPDTIGIPPYRTVKFHQNFVFATKLSSSEFLPQSTAPNSVFGNITSVQQPSAIGVGGSFGYSSALTNSPNTLYLKVNTGAQTLADYTRMVTITNRVMLNYGNPYTSEFYPTPIRTRLRQFLGFGWRPMFRGQYQVSYFYEPPFNLCDTLDDFIIPTTNRKSYTY